MTPAAICAALAASAPVAAASWLGGAVFDLRGAPSQRHMLWSAAFWSGPACTLAALGVMLAPAHAALIAVALRGVAGPLARAGALANAAGPGGVQAWTLVLIAYAAVATYRLCRFAQRWAKLLRISQRAARDDGVWPEGPYEVRLSDEVATPMVVGLFGPVLILPKGFAAAGAGQPVSLVCRHEAAHIRRADNLRLLVEELASATLWFNLPLIAARHRMIAAREEICDDLALSGATPAQRRQYARSLVRTFEAPSAPATAPGFIGLGRRSLMQRVTAIVEPKPAPGRRWPPPRRARRPPRPAGWRSGLIG